MAWLYMQDKEGFFCVHKYGDEGCCDGIFKTAEEAAARCHYLNGGNAEALEHISRALESIAAEMREIRQIMQAKARGET